MDYDQNIQKQFVAAQEVEWPQSIVKDSALITWSDVEQSAGANKEWFWNALMPPVAFFGNFMKVKVHAGWIGTVSRMGALVLNPGSRIQ